MNSKLLSPILLAVGASIEEMVRRALRSSGQKKLQKRVNETSPVTAMKDLSVADDCIQITILNDKSLDLTQYREVLISDKEANEWKALISTLGGEMAKTIMTVSSFNGLVKCDVPLKFLCRIKDNPHSMRGMVLNDGKISKHASFSEARLGSIAPLLVYQCMAAVTSQYYQQIIAERLNVIDSKLDNVIEILTEDDRSKLKVAYSRFVGLSKKNTYDIADKQIVSEFSGYVEIIREKYRGLLLKIEHLNVDYKWSDKKEAEFKIQALQNSRYFEYLTIAMLAEALTFIAFGVSVRIATYLADDEDAKIYAEKMNLDYWNNYVDQFSKIKHDVIKYLELQADSSLLHGKSISALKDEQIKKFNAVETSMVDLQRQFECKTVQYIKAQEDGTLVKYISVTKD